MPFKCISAFTFLLYTTMAGLEHLIQLIYHEKQQEGSMLCAQHALNSLLRMFPIVILHKAFSLLLYTEEHYVGSISCLPFISSAHQVVLQSSRPLISPTSQKISTYWRNDTTITIQGMPVLIWTIRVIYLCATSYLCLILH